jgi:hypothetical protein
MGTDKIQTNNTIEKAYERPGFSELTKDKPNVLYSSRLREHAAGTATAV